jgi:hypothetical protein
MLKRATSKGLPIPEFLKKGITETKNENKSRKNMKRIACK